MITMPGFTFGAMARECPISVPRRLIEDHTRAMATLHRAR